MRKAELISKHTVDPSIEICGCQWEIYWFIKKVQKSMDSSLFVPLLYWCLNFCCVSKIYNCSWKIYRLTLSTCVCVCVCVIFPDHGLVTTSALICDQPSNSLSSQMEADRNLISQRYGAGLCVSQGRPSCNLGTQTIIYFNPLVPRVQNIKSRQFRFRLTLTGLICKGNGRFWHSLSWALGTNGLKRSEIAACNFCFLKIVNYTKVPFRHKLVKKINAYELS